MPENLLELKSMVINELAGQFDLEEKEELGKRFNLSSEKMDELIRELLNKWLASADLVIMVADLLGLSVPRKSKEKKSHHYIG